MTLQPGEFITRTDSQDDKWIFYLTLTTNKGQSLSGGRGDWGDWGDRRLHWTVPANSAVLGLGGRAGGYCDQLQLLYVTFAPAKWAMPR